MATTTATTTDLAQVLADVLESVDGLRVYPYVADQARVPFAVVALPAVDYLDPEAAFCAATWTFPVVLVVSRSNDREAQAALSRFLQIVTSTLGSTPVPGVLSIDPVDARPTTVTVSGQELPGYSINVRVRA
jgi:hypothetical protein